MSKHYHYYVAYSISGQLGSTAFGLDREIDTDALTDILSDLNKRFKTESIVITFFSEIKCNCREYENDR